jgi:hypothetical protein
MSANPDRPDGGALRVTATPARHGPAGIELLSGDVIGFMLSFADPDIRPIYITGDTVRYDGVAVVPLHAEGWAHFTQGREDLKVSFNALRVGSRLRLLEPGIATAIEVPG